MARPSARIVISPAIRSELRRYTRLPRAQARYAQRAGIVLLAAEGLTNLQIAARLGTRPARVSKWRKRFAAKGIGGLFDSVRPGATPKYDETVEQRLLSQLDQPPPTGHTCWNGALLAEALGDVSEGQVWRVLRRLGVKLQRRQSWYIPTDPHFAATVVDVVGLYLAPPENIVAISVEKTPFSQAPGDVRGWLKIPSRRAMKVFAENCKQHGVIPLVVAFEMAAGRVYQSDRKRRRRKDYLDFIAELEAVHPQKDIHVLVDDSGAGAPVEPDLRKKYPRLHFHFSHSHANWLSQIEVWFSVIGVQSADFAGFDRTKDLVAHVDVCIKRRVEDEHCAPFEWIKAHPGANCAPCKYANLCKYV